MLTEPLSFLLSMTIVIRSLLNETILSFFFFLYHHLHGGLHCGCLTKESQCNNVLRATSVYLDRINVAYLCNTVSII